MKRGRGRSLSAANPGAEPCWALVGTHGGLAGPLTQRANTARNAVLTLLPVSRRSEAPEGTSAWRSLRSPHTVSHPALQQTAPISFPDTLSPGELEKPPRSAELLRP